MIEAYSPQARGRSERNFCAWQGRLLQDLRVRGIKGLAQANNFLRNEHVAEFNCRLMVAPHERVARLCVPGARISTGSSAYSTNAPSTTTTPSRWKTVSSNSIKLARWRNTLAGQTVIVHEHLDGRASIFYGPHVIAQYAALCPPPRPLKPILKSRRWKTGHFTRYLNRTS